MNSTGRNLVVFLAITLFVFLGNVKAIEENEVPVIDTNYSELLDPELPGCSENENQVVKEIVEGSPIIYMVTDLSLGHPLEDLTLDPAERRWFSFEYRMVNLIDLTNGVNMVYSVFPECQEAILYRTANLKYVDSLVRFLPLQFLNQFYHLEEDYQLIYDNALSDERFWWRILGELSGYFSLFEVEEGNA